MDKTANAAVAEADSTSAVKTNMSATEFALRRAARAEEKAPVQTDLLEPEQVVEEEVVNNDPPPSGEPEPQVEGDIAMARGAAQVVIVVVSGCDFAPFGLQRDQGLARADREPGSRHLPRRRLPEGRQRAEECRAGDPQGASASSSRISSSAPAFTGNSHLIAAPPGGSQRSL